MASLPTDRDSADDALNDNHDDHHNVLHATHNALDALDVGEVLVGLGSGTWEAQAKLPTKTEVDALGINAATLQGSTLAQVIAASGGGSGAVQAVPVTITGDGTATSFDVTHNLGTRSVEWYFEDANNAPLKVSSWVPTVGDELNSSTISIPGPIGDGDEVYGYAEPATGVAGGPLPLYALTGYTATLPTGESVIATYADLAAFLAAVDPGYQGQRVQLASGSLVTLLEARWSAGDWVWKDIT